MAWHGWSPLMYGVMRVLLIRTGYLPEGSRANHGANYLIRRRLPRPPAESYSSYHRIVAPSLP